MPDRCRGLRTYGTDLRRLLRRSGKDRRRRRSPRRLLHRPAGSSRAPGPLQSRSRRPQCTCSARRRAGVAAGTTRAGCGCCSTTAAPTSSASVGVTARTTPVPWRWTWPRRGWTTRSGVRAVPRPTPESDPASRVRSPAWSRGSPRADSTRMPARSPRICSTARSTANGWHSLASRASTSHWAAAQQSAPMS